MESQKSFLLIGLAFVTYLLWEQWQVDQLPPPAPVAQQTQIAAPKGVQSVDSGIPSNTSAPTLNAVASGEVPTSTNDVPTAIPAVVSSNSIWIKTDVIEAQINLLGGDITTVKLLDYDKEKYGEEPFSILAESGKDLFHAQTGLIGNNGPDSNKNGRPVYQAQQDSYILNGETLVVPLSFITQDGLVITKNFTFTQGQYDIKIDFVVNNQSSEMKNVQLFSQFKQAVIEQQGSMMMPTYHGAAYSTHEQNYEKISFDDIFESNLKENSNGGWIAMIEHYFVAAFVPNKDEQIEISTTGLAGQQAILRYIGGSANISPNTTQTLSTILYAGPKDQDALAKLAEHLDLTVDYGFLWFISQPLFSLLTFIQSIVINWGVAIIIITIIVKGAMYPLTKKQYTSMAKLRQLQPKLTALKERCGDDKQKFSQAMMELYRKEKVNPMGGCLPMVIQMPIFLALYWVFVESVELRHAEFALWIHDLSQLDPYYVLPVLMGASMFIMQKLQPTPMQDPVQQKIFQYMPVAFTFFFLWFPAGLVLYWLVSNIISIIQMLVINKSIAKQGLK